MYVGGLWLVVLGGLVPSLYFISTYRPRRRLAARQLDAGGWVFIIAALYALQTWRLSMGSVAVPRWPEGLGVLVIGAAIDGLLWLRVLVWRRVRQAVARGEVPARRHDDPPPGS